MSEFQDGDLGGNPYRSPFSGSEALVVGDESGQAITHRVLSTLRETQPWVRFLSVLGFICSVLMVFVGSLGFLATLLAGARQGLVATFVPLVYIPLGIIYFIPSLFLFRYASRINAMWTTRNMRQLEDALAAQKSFWKYVGILAIAVIALYLVGIAFFVFTVARVHPH
jgi:hypothetical protein